MSESLTFTIGDVSISIEGEVRKGDWKILPVYRPFIRPGGPDISLCLHVGPFSNSVGKKIFECPPVWALYRQNGTSVIKLFHEYPGVARTLVFPSYFERADLYFEDESGPFIDPFYGPTLEILMVNYLAQGKGVIVHACGIAKAGRGLLFVGESGAGKSTLARLWHQESGVEILGDDRIIVRKRGDQFWAYGTPWHGDAEFALPRAVKLERIFFLRQNQENAMRAVKGVDPVSRFLTCSFPPLWDHAGMEYTLELFNELSADVTCQELAFKRDRTSLDFINKIISA
jgi:hypothetical protein